MTMSCNKLLTNGLVIEPVTRTDTALKPMRWIEQLPTARERFVLGISATVAIASAAWILRTVADPFLPPGFSCVTFFPVVIVTSFLFGARLVTDELDNELRDVPDLARQTGHDADSVEST